MAVRVQEKSSKPLKRISAIITGRSWKITEKDLEWMRYRFDGIPFKFDAIIQDNCCLFMGGECSFTVFCRSSPLDVDYPLKHSYLFWIDCVGMDSLFSRYLFLTLHALSSFSFSLHHI